MTMTLDAEVPVLAAEHLEKYGWKKGWGKYGPGATGKTCAHGAVLSVCGNHPGDQYLWRAILDGRGLTTSQNDESDGPEVIGKLRGFGEPTEAEMAKAFGPQWKAVRKIVRQLAVETKEQVQQLAAALAAARGAALAAARAEAWAAARGAALRAEAWAEAWDAARAAALRDAERDARDAAWDALAVCMAVDLIGKPGVTFTQEQADKLFAPWRSVFGDPLTDCDK